MTNAMTYLGMKTCITSDAKELERGGCHHSAGGRRLPGRNGAAAGSGVGPGLGRAGREKADFGDMPGDAAPV